MIQCNIIIINKIYKLEENIFFNWTKKYLPLIWILLLHFLKKKNQKYNNLIQLHETVKKLTNRIKQFTSVPWKKITHHFWLLRLHKSSHIKKSLGVLPFKKCSFRKSVTLKLTNLRDTLLTITLNFTTCTSWMRCYINKQQNYAKHQNYLWYRRRWWCYWLRRDDVSLLN